MLLKSIELTDFLSHSSTKLNFSEKSHTLVSGVSGSGKSSLFEAITWNLFGIGRSESRNLVRKGQKKATVVLVLEDRDDTWTITRSVTAKGVQSLEIEHYKGHDEDPTPVPATSLKEKQAFIEKEVVKSNFELFTNGPYWLQGGGRNFLQLPASERKELLLQIAGYSSVEELDEKAKKWVGTSELRLSEIATEIRVGESSIQSDLTAVEKFEKSDDYDFEEKHGYKFEVLETAISDGEAKVPELQKAWSELNVSLTAATNRSNERSILFASLPALKSDEEVAGWKSELETLSVRASDIVVAKTEIAKLESLREAGAKYQKDKTKLESDLSSFEASIASAQSMLNDLVARLNSAETADDICPATQKVCHKAAALIEKRKDELKADISKCTDGIATYTANKKECEARIAALMPVEFDSQKLADLKASVADEVTVNSRIASLKLLTSTEVADRAKHAGIIAKLAELPELDVAGLAERISEVEKARKDAQDKLTADKLSLANLNGLKKAWEASKAAYDGAKARIKEFAEKKDLLEGESNRLNAQLSDVKLLREAFGANGIKAVIVDTMLPRIENKANEVLAELCDLRVMLDTQRESADGKKQVEGLFVTVKNGQGEEVPFESLSGGESLKVTCGINEALASLQNCSFRMVDEMIGNLDEESVAAFTEILMKLTAKFPQYLMISHLPTVQNLFDEKVTVMKKDGISHIE